MVIVQNNMYICREERHYTNPPEQGSLDLVVSSTNLSEHCILDPVVSSTKLS